MVMLVSRPELTPVEPGETENINLKLLVWEQDGEVHFVYGPTSDAVFKTEADTKTVTIELIHANDSPTLQDPQFWMSHYTTNRTKAIKSVSPEAREQDGSYTKIPHHDKDYSQIGNDSHRSKRVTFEVDLPPGHSFYLNILIKQKGKPQRLISCDPQVENGSRP